MIKTLSYRLKDSTMHKHLEAHSRSVNVVWNFCNDTQRFAIKWNKQWPTGFDLSKLCAGSSKDLDLHSQSIQAVCEEYATRRKQTKKRWLRYRGKRSLGWIPFKASGLKLNGDRVGYQGQTYCLWLSRPVEGAIKTGGFSQDARGRWYIHIACEVANPVPSQGTQSIGIDLGLKTLATLSNGTEIEAKRFYRDVEPKLAIAQRARKKPCVQALHAKIKNRRKDFLHKASTRLVADNAAIFVGNVNASKLAKTKMAKSVLDAGWSAFKTMLAYKAMARQVWFEEIDERNTTRTCSECAALSGPKDIAGLGIRDWVCRECGCAHDRDVNSAKLVLAAGHRRLVEGILVF
jgi:IS605 OrfB family transposase